MSFPLILGHVASLVLLVFLLVYAVQNRGRPGSKSLIVMFGMLLVWAVSSFTEYLVPDGSKLVFRNTGQIGVFCIPAALWSFVRSYTGKIAGHGRRERWVIGILAAFALLSSLLFVTDSWHHLVRGEMQVAAADGGMRLAIQSTPLGLVFVSLNYVVVGACVIQLLLFVIRNGGVIRIQLSLFLLAILVTMGYAVYRQFGGTFHIPISWLFSISGLILVFGAYRYDFLRVTPIARNLAFDVLEEGIVVCSSDGRIIDMNAAGHALLLPDGGSYEEAASVLDHGIPDRRMPHVPSHTRHAEFVLTVAAGAKTLHMTSYPVTTDRDLVLGSVSVLRDVTLLRRQNAILVEKAERDGLTGLFNRATFVDRVERRLLSGAETVALLLFDIDDFKSINDLYGHVAGDQVLKGVCGRVSADLREGDVFGRLGGDEFAIFLTGLEPAAVSSLAERIRVGVAAEPLAAPTTLSIGSVVRQARTFSELYHAADTALYEAKRQGKNRISAAD